VAKLSELSDAQRRSLAKRHLSGHMLIDLEGFAGLSVAQLRKLFSSQRMKTILGEEQQYLDSCAVRIRNRMSYGIEDSVDRMKARGAGSDGPQLAYKADEFLISSLLPKQERHLVENRTEVSFDAQVAVQITDALDTMKTIMGQGNGNSQIELSKHTLLGMEGIATIEPDGTTQDLAVEVSSGSDSPRPYTGPEDSGGEPEPPPSA